MARRRSKSIGVGWIVILILVCVGAAASVAYYATKDSVRTPNNAAHNSTVVQPPVPRPAPAQQKVVIYIPESDNDRFYLVPVTRTTTMKGDKLDVAMRTLLATTSETGEAGRLIPQGTELLYPVDVKDNVAVVDLSREFLDNFNGGSTQEALTLNAIAHTLVKNSDGRVDQVQILVEGRRPKRLVDTSR